VKGLMTIPTKVTTNVGTVLVMRSVVALLLAGCLPVCHAQTAAGRLHISVNVQASYYVEAKGESNTSIGCGTADGNNLRVAVQPGPVAVRVLKANSGSPTYSVVVRGGQDELRFRNLPYDTTITAVIPDSKPDLALALYVIPD
jgi:hypothetical protein